MKKMTMTKLFTLAALALMGVTMSSCGDDDEDVKVEPVDPLTEAKANLSNNIWHFMRIIISDDEIEETYECTQASDVLFKNDGVYEVIMADICEDDAEDIKGTWRITDKMDSLFITTNDHTETYLVVELTDEKLLLETPDKGNNINAGWRREYVAE